VEVSKTLDCLTLPAELMAEIVAHARAGYPEEVCGLIAGTAGVARELWHGRNVSPTPRMTYLLDDETLVRQIDFEEAGLTLVAIYHSHPLGPQEPSPVDIAGATYPDSVYLVVDLSVLYQPALAGFRIIDRTVQRIQVRFE
jgi:proteasome lid subunit RPN8/RPN11